MWVLSRPHNWRPRSADEALVQISLQSGSVLGRTVIPTRYTAWESMHACTIIRNTRSLGDAATCLSQVCT